MKRDAKLKLIGWVGMSEGRPFFEEHRDAYADSPAQRAEVFKTPAQAKARFQHVQRVWIWAAPRKGKRK